MKNKTMLKFLLCFLIIGMGIQINYAEAALTPYCDSCEWRTCGEGDGLLQCGKDYVLEKAQQPTLGQQIENVLTVTYEAYVHKQCSDCDGYIKVDGTCTSGKSVYNNGYGVWRHAPNNSVVNNHRTDFKRNINGKNYYPAVDSEGNRMYTKGGKAIYYTVDDTKWFYTISLDSTGKKFSIGTVIYSVSDSAFTTGVLALTYFDYYTNTTKNVDNSNLNLLTRFTDALLMQTDRNGGYYYDVKNNKIVRLWYDSNPGSYTYKLADAKCTTCDGSTIVLKNNKLMCKNTNVPVLFDTGRDTGFVHSQQVDCPACNTQHEVGKYNLSGYTYYTCSKTGTEYVLEKSGNEYKKMVCVECKVYATNKESFVIKKSGMFECQTGFTMQLIDGQWKHASWQTNLKSGTCPQCHQYTIMPSIGEGTYCYCYNCDYVLGYESMTVTFSIKDCDDCNAGKGITKSGNIYTCVNKNMKVEIGNGVFGHSATPYCEACGKQHEFDSSQFEYGYYVCTTTNYIVKKESSSQDYFGGNYKKVSAYNSSCGYVMKVSGKYICENHKIELARDNNGFWKHVEVLAAEKEILTAGPSAKWFLTVGRGENLTNAFDIVNQNMGPILHIQSLIMIISILASVIVIGIYAIQWMTAAPAKRQELKTGAWSLVIGIILLIVGPQLAVLIVEVLLGL